MKTPQLVLIALLVVALALLPIAITRDDTLNLACVVLLYVTLASSWNILGGYTGQTNLGHAAFFGLGALVARFMWLAGWPLFVSILAGGLVAVALAVVIGAPAFRLRGVYFAIGMLAMAQVFFITVSNVFGQISTLPTAVLDTYDRVPRYYMFLGLAVLTVAASYFLTHSRVGIGLMAVREEEDAAESLGISALRHKLIALLASAFFAGLAGGAFAYYQAGYYPKLPFNPEYTFDSLMMAYIGGTGTIVGPVIGAVFMVLIREFLALKLGEFHQIVFGVLFILVVLFMPTGFVGAWNKVRAMIGRRPGVPKGPVVAGTGALKPQ